MDNRRRRYGLFFSSLGITILSGCVITTGVEAPSQVFPNSTFQAVVTVEIDADGEDIGQLGVLIPQGWNADNVTYAGPYSGVMLYDSTYSGGGCSPWDHWIGFATAESLACVEGDTFEITVSIYTDGIIGFVDIAFIGEPSPQYAVPCSTTVEVVELNLEQSTWGAVKSEFRL